MRFLFQKKQCEGCWLMILLKRASPRLKDASISAERYEGLYHDLMLTVRKIYHTCRLVHADLSEYNLLYHADELWIIDVSQSVEHDHPSAFEFLRMDLKNVKVFFEGRGVRCLTVVKAFEFVTRESLDKSEGDVLREWLEIEEEDVGSGDHDEEVKTKLEDEAAAHKATEDSVFMRSFIPRSLNEVLDPERAVLARAAPNGSGAVEGVTKGVPLSPERNTKVRFTGVPQQEDESNDDEEEGDGDVSEEETEGRVFTDRQPRGHRHEDKEAKKVWGLLVSSMGDLFDHAKTGEEKGRQGGTTGKTENENAQSREKEEDQKFEGRWLTGV